MVLFNTLLIISPKISLLLQKKGIMTKISYQLRSEEQVYAAGITNLHEGLGHSLNTNGCTVLFCTSGSAVVSANFRRQALKKGEVAILFSDIFFVPEKTSRDFSVIFISLSEDILEDAYHKMTSLSFWDFIYDNPIFNLNDKQYSLMHNWCQQVIWCIEECSSEYRLSILSNCIYNLFMVIDSEVRQINAAMIKQLPKNRAWTLLGKFYSLISRYCRENREVKFYADKMCITTDYLYKITNKTMQQTPKEVIDQQISLEIKSYLASTNMSVKDIASEMNFEDSSYMCRFFRRVTGYSPGEFRENH